MPTAPLTGIRVVVTRAEHQAGGLAEEFAKAGAVVELLPLLEIVPAADPRPLERAAAELALFDWLVFTSVNAVDAFLPLTGGVVPDRVRIAVVGGATAAALTAWELAPHLVAGRSEAEGLLADLAPHVDRGRRILLPQAADARPTLADGLARLGAEPVAVVAYDKALPAAAARRAAELFSAASLGWVTFTSPRIVRHFVELLGEMWERRRAELRAASIGAVTNAELRRYGAEPAAVADQPSDAAMVAAVVRAVAAHT